MKEVQPYKLMALYVSWLVKLLKFGMKAQSLLLLLTSTIPVVTSTILVRKAKRNAIHHGRNCGPKANVVVISQTYLRHLFEEGNLSAHIILRSHVSSAILWCPPGQALQIFRSPPTIPKVKIPEDTLRQVVGAVRIEVNNFLGMLCDVASGRDLKKFLTVVAALWVLSIVGSW
ncbi:reticulon-like protein B2, partial [Tanacetum coccineum]